MSRTPADQPATLGVDQGGEEKSYCIIMGPGHFTSFEFTGADDLERKLSVLIELEKTTGK